VDEVKIDVSDLLKSVGAELEVEKSEKLDFGSDLTLSSPVKVNLKLINTGGTVLVTGTINTTVKLNCSRCLKQFDQPIILKIEEEYAKKGQARDLEEEDESDDEGLELKDDDFVFEISEENLIDIGEAIRQNVLVSLPVKPLCTKNCIGIKVAEAPKQKKIDPRLEKLKEFKFAMEACPPKRSEGG
jgi:uncharacterized protein